MLNAWDVVVINLLQLISLVQQLLPPNVILNTHRHTLYHCTNTHTETHAQCTNCHHLHRHTLYHCTNDYTDTHTLYQLQTSTTTFSINVFNAPTITKCLVTSHTAVRKCQASVVGGKVKYTSICMAHHRNYL